MSFSLIQPINENESINDSIFWGADSDNTGKTNFKYVFDVLNGSGQLLIRSKIYPEPNNTRGFFDVSSVLRNELDLDFIETPGNYQGPLVVKQLNKFNNIQLEYTIQAGEEYNEAYSGVTTLNMASGTAYAYNYVPNLWKRQDPYYFTELSNKYLTNRPKKIRVNFDYNDFQNVTQWEQILIGLNSYNIETDGKFYLMLNTYDSNDNLLVQSYYQAYDGNEYISTSLSNYVQIDISPYNINLNAELTGSINNNTAYYDVQILDGYYNVCDSIRVYIDKCKGNYPIYNLHFMNSLGMFDTARFTCVDKLQMQVTRKSFNKKDVIFKSGFGGLIPSYDNDYKLNETKINYGQNIEHTLKLTMDFPTDEEYEWLSELFYSPLIYLNHENKYYPITIKNTNYDYIKRISSKLKTLEIDVELNLKRNAIKR